MKAKIKVTVVENTMIAGGVYRIKLLLPAKGCPDNIRPGQFVGVYVPDASKLLPRPISINFWEPDERILTLVYRVSGEGTSLLSKVKTGESLSVIGILGNGYPMEELLKKNVLLAGGGIGAPPLLELAKQLRAGGSDSRITAVLGYRTDDLFLVDEFRQYADVIIATDDGTAGFKGNVIEAAKDAGGAYDTICACGPMPMLRGVKAYAAELGIPAYISLEERMACGVGVCLGCVCKTVHRDAHSLVNNARVCTEGPVFPAEEVDI